mgnify:CR=1 FL=1
MKKFSKSIIAFAVISISAASFAFAAAAVENKTAGCCAKAQSEGKTCAHPCCVEAAKAGDNCTKCKGSGKIQTQEKKGASKKKAS